MVEAKPTKFYTNFLLWIKQPSFLPDFYLVLTVSGEFQNGWVAGAGGRQDGGLKFLRERDRNGLGQVIGHPGH